MKRSCEDGEVRATPYVHVDSDIVDANINSMQVLCDSWGIALRPHAKTHKSVDVGRRQLLAGAAGLTVATVGEGEAFADLLAEFGKDLFVAYPVAASPTRLRELAGRVPTIVGVDASDAVRRAAEAGVAISIEIDSGLRRSGVAPHDAGELASLARSLGVRVNGVFTFPGHGYGLGAARASAAADEGRALTAATASLRSVGVDDIVASGGCTPTAALTHENVVNEMRPGVYVFMDAGQLAMGSAAPDQVALTVRTTVVSNAVPGQVVLDAGAKVLAMDRLGFVDTHGLVPAYPETRLTRLWEHHGVLEIPDGSPRPALGEQLDIIPNHVCATVNLVDELVAGDNSWPVSARGKNS
jgi:D-serine deaminase-like pyridoxal phosphate-dependent protein